MKAAMPAPFITARCVKGQAWSGGRAAGPQARRGGARPVGEGLPDPLLNETTLCSPFCPGQKGLGARAQAATA